jgi:peptidoglycan hydrolase CwlO-like protein
VYLKTLILSLSAILVTATFFFSPTISYSKTLDEEIAEISKQISDLEKAIAPLKNETVSLQSKIANSRLQITKTENQINDLSQKLIDKESDLEIQKILLSSRVRRYYINSKKFNPLTIFLATNDGSHIVKQYAWYQSIISQDKSTITKYINDIINLNQNKVKLEQEKSKLATLKKTMESRFGFLATEIKKAEDYKKALSQRQQQLIAEKNAMFNTSVGDVSVSDDPASRSDYNPGFSPAFAAFSFGAPHRKGMSQFGAFGRAKNGQGYETILKAYYGDIKIETVDMPGNIKTSIGSLPFENNYLVGIAEMPAKWGDEGGFEALKAQAIAARTYALNSTGWSLSNRNSSGTICVTEACQVYKKSRLDSPGTWKRAVEETRGKIIVSNKTGNIFTTFYASTAGGAINGYSSSGHSAPQIWDTKCGNQSCWPSDSYEKLAGSGWFYKGWYKTRSNVTAGRSHPWLNQEEFSDIANAILYFDRTHDSSHLSQTQNCLGSCDPSAWSKDELRRQVGDKGGPISSVNSVSVDYSTGGYTQKVRLSTDKGDLSFDGDDFKEIFTLRAPGAITIKSSLFNIEKK